MGEEELIEVKDGEIMGGVANKRSSRSQANTHTHTQMCLRKAGIVGRYNNRS